MAANQRSASLVLLLVALGACADDAVRTTPLEVDPAVLSASAGQEIPSRSEERPGTFLDLSDEELWERVSASGGVAAVGLKAPGRARGVYEGQLLLTRAQWSQARNAVTGRPGAQLLRADDLLPVIEVRFADLQTLRTVRRLPVVDYLEPVFDPHDIQPFAAFGGCGYGSAWGSDRQYTSGGDVYSEKFAAMSIPAAWALSSGRGITIGLIDTGISGVQQQLLAQFATGESAGRTLTLRQISSYSDPYDGCGHGTRMAGVIAAPRDGLSVTGVAWRSNLLSVRQSNGVANVPSGDAKQSVRIAAQGGAQIVVMGWQSMNWWWQVSDEIKYWHRNRPILFIAAAGTSGCGDGILDSNVVFPADMGEVMAVTGQRHPDNVIPCGIHYGKQVELTAYMDVPTTGQRTEDMVGIGGSSNATAVVAGIAALTWSYTPWLTRDQLRQRLWTAGALYPNRNGSRGYGLLDARKAVAGK
jgi:serine protease